MEDKIFRYSIKAIIIRDGKLLAESCDYGRGRFCKLPGGGHQWGETMEQALIRECKEELSAAFGFGSGLYCQKSSFPAG